MPDLKTVNLFLRVIDNDPGSDAAGSGHNLECTLFVIMHDGPPGAVFTLNASSVGTAGDLPPSPIQDLNDETGAEGFAIQGVDGLVLSFQCKIPGVTSMGKSEINNYQAAPLPFP